MASKSDPRDRLLQSAEGCYWKMRRARGARFWQSFYEKLMWEQLLRWAEPRGPGRPKKSI